MRALGSTLVSLIACLVGTANAQGSASVQPQCSTTLSNKGYATPSIAAPYQYRLVATNLRTPRGIIFDSAGNLLVVQQRDSIVALSLNGDGDCVTAGKPSTVVDNSDVGASVLLLQLAFHLSLPCTKGLC